MSRIIKNNSPVSVAPLGRVVALNVANFAEQAQKTVIEAQTRASQIIAQATTRAAELERQAQQRGHDEGYQRGLADGQADGAERAFNEARQKFEQQSAELQKMLRQTILQLEQARNELLQQARSELLDLALAIAEKVTHVQAAGDIQVAQASLSKAVEMIGCSGQVRARVCPAQLDQLREYAGEFLAEMGRGELVSFVPDPALNPGDVVLATRRGEVDARIQTQIDNIVTALTGQEKDAPEEPSA